MVVSETHQRSTLTNSKFPNPLILKRGSCDAPGAACEEGGRDGRAAISDLLAASATLPARSSGRALAVPRVTASFFWDPPVLRLQVYELTKSVGLRLCKLSALYLTEKEHLLKLKRRLL